MLNKGIRDRCNMNLMGMARKACTILALSGGIQAAAQEVRTEPSVQDPLADIKRATIAIGWRESSAGHANQVLPLFIGCSGFMYSYTPSEFVEGKSEPDAAGYVYHWAQIWVVTAAHCVQGKEKVIARINSNSGSTHFYEIPADRWAIHDDEDVAVAGLPTPSGNPGLTPAEEAQIRDTDIKTLTPEMFASRERLRQFGVFEYTPVAIVGFPFGRHRSDLRNYPLVRGGRIAQIQGYLDGDPNHRTFLVAGSVFGGNSGGPVVIPEGTMSLDGTSRLSGNVLIGLISYGKVGLPPVRESLDLAGVVGMDAIHEVIYQRLAEERTITSK